MLVAALRRDRTAGSRRGGAARERRSTYRTEMQTVARVDRKNTPDRYS
jgi:hypothetical protein